MDASSDLDLLLIDDEDDLFSGGAGGEDEGVLLNFAVYAARWALEAPKLAVPLLSAQAKAAGLAVESVYRPLLPWKHKRFRALLARRPLAVGVTTVAMFKPDTLRRLVSVIRAVSPGSAVVLGGHGAADVPELRALGDLWISNHGEGQLAAAVSELKKGVKLCELPGVSREPGGALALQGSLRYEGMLRVLPPDWSAASTACRRYPVEASRGCRFNCAFCGFCGRGGQVFRPADEVADELLQVSRGRGIRRFEFVDSSLTSDPAFVRELCAAIRRRELRLDWKCFARPDAFAKEPELAREMAAAGCSRVFMGIESIHDPILAAMRRGMTRETVELGLGRAFEAGIKVHGNFIIGFPGETAATVEETAKFVSRRRFASVFLCTFGASQEMLDLAAREPERYAHLAGRPVKGWKHDGMDYQEAYRLTLRAVRKINLAKLWPTAFSPATNHPARPPF